MTEKATTPPALDESFAKLKSAMDVQVAEIKRDLAQWLDQRRGPTDRTAAIIALAFMFEFTPAGEQIWAYDVRASEPKVPKKPRSRQC